MSDYNDDDELEQGAGLEPTPASLAHYLEEQYVGDDRFETIEVLDPSPHEGEAVRVCFSYDDVSQFFVAVLEEDGLVRVGLMTQEKALSERLESAAQESADSLTEFLEVSLESGEELDHEVQHFHDDAFYFCSDIPYQRDDDLASEILRDEIIYYLDGYIGAFYGLLDEA
ncbi:MAG TPA: hypothetical protein PLS90_17225 [Candidatus Sumerlaeota bacterium]|nr:hypothetical protein [Candidatus Sumerlaeota bacterium]HOR29364.1 hypothetical protein [Candidatus Sumerlaeota bacterium]HPK04190.1 hypothetical protein [Candidatus Sumerlaeota bacterium]